MKRLNEKQTEAIRKEFVDNFNNDKYYKKICDTKARFEAPLGEIVKNLTGFAMVWKMQNQLPKPQPITEKDSFNAQGLEGKIVIETTLNNALNYYFACDPYRRAIYI